MNYRILGRTGLKVSELGFGAWGIGKVQWLGGEDQKSLNALKLARDLGVNFYDTALAYGNGHSEQLLAQAFGNSPEVVIASKIPPKNRIWPANPKTPLSEVFPKHYVLASLEESLRNLGRDAIDVYQFHVWTDAWADNDEWLETLREIRESGKVRWVGISVTEHDAADVLKALNTGLIDVVQVIYNIFDQSPEDELLPYCSKNDIGVIARVPFDEGGLTGKVRPETEFEATDFRARYFRDGRKQEVWERVQAIARDLDIELDRLAEIALRFCLSDQSVSTVIPGMRSPSNVKSNAAASEAGPLPKEILEKLRAHRWERNFYL